MSNNLSDNAGSAGHRYHLRVYYEDTDAGGVVYHAGYLRFAERARTEALRDAGVPHAEMTAQYGLMFMVRRLKVDYLAPARLDDLLFVVTRPIGAACRIGGASPVHLPERRGPAPGGVGGAAGLRTAHGPAARTGAGALAVRPDVAFVGAMPEWAVDDALGDQAGVDQAGWSGRTGRNGFEGNGIVQGAVDAANLGAAAGDLSVWGLFVQADIVVKLVMVILLLASVWVWAIVFEKITSCGVPTAPPMSSRTGSGPVAAWTICTKKRAPSRPIPWPRCSVPP